jgi:hypothetical protein
MKPFTQPIAHWRQKKLELSRASPPILSMWSCKNISHIQVLVTNLFPPQPRKLEIGTACRWEILIATGCYCSSSGFTGLKVINLIQDFQCTKPISHTECPWRCSYNQKASYCGYRNTVAASTLIRLCIKMFSTKKKILRRKLENVLKYSWHGIFKIKRLLSKHMLKLALYYGTLVCQNYCQTSSLISSIYINIIVTLEGFHPSN